MLQENVYQNWKLQKETVWIIYITLYSIVCGKKKTGLIIMIMKGMASKSKCAWLEPDHLPSLLLPN